MNEEPGGIIYSKLLQQAGIFCATSTKLLGNFHQNLHKDPGGLAEKNTASFIQRLGLGRLSNLSLVIMEAKHSSNIAFIELVTSRGIIPLKSDDPNIIKLFPGNLSPKLLKNIDNWQSGVDAIYCDLINVFLGLLHADCAPIGLFDPNSGFFALIHAGLIGTMTELVPKTISILHEEHGVAPQNLLAYVGPTICQEHYNMEASIHWQEIQAHKLLAQNAERDLKTILRQQLLASGLQSGKIEISPFCTAEHPELFFSHHQAKDKLKEGRLLTIIGL